MDMPEKKDYYKELKFRSELSLSMICTKFKYANQKVKSGANFKSKIGDAKSLCVLYKTNDFMLASINIMQMEANRPIQPM